MTEELTQVTETQDLPENPEEQAVSTETTETAEEQAGAEQTQEQEEHLYAGKYRSIEDLEKAYNEAQYVIGRQGQELGKYTQQAPAVDPIQVSAYIARHLPSQLAYAESLPAPVVERVCREYGMTPEQVAALESADWGLIVSDMKNEIRSHQTTQQQQAAQTAQQFATTYADLAPHLEDVAAIDSALTASGAYARCQTEQEAYELLARTSRAVLGLQNPVSDAARILGQRGGQAAAQTRQPPPPPGGGTSVVSGGGGQRTGIQHSAFEDLTDWSH